MNVAVVIPCYNSAAWVGEAVESALAQTAPPAEVIVVNDGSTDDSRAVLRPYEPRVRVIDQANRGLGGARNAGAAAARADWLAFLDADDVYEPGFLAGVRALHAAFPAAEMMFTDHVEFGPAAAPAASMFDRCVPEQRRAADAAHGDLLVGSQRFLEPLLMRNGAFAPSTLVVSRGLFDRVGGFYEHILGAEDLDFYAHAAPQTAVGVVHRPLLRKRVHHTSLGRHYGHMRPTMDVFRARAEAFYRARYPHLLPLARRKYCAQTRSWGRHEFRLGLYAAARATYGRLIRAEPLRPQNWYGLAKAVTLSWLAGGGPGTPPSAAPTGVGPGVAP
jgi:glycosyltransferase involved in cell wall biosynthesis